MDEWLTSWDFAHKDKEEADFTVGQVWARKGAQFFLVDQVRARMDAPEALSAFRNVSQRYPQAGRKLMEDAAMAPAIESLTRKQLPGIILVPVKGSKASRLFTGTDTVSAYIEAGNVFLPPLSVPWVAEYIEEFAVFPNGTHDDVVDATTLALADMARRAHGVIDEAHRLALEKGKPTMTVQEEFDKNLQRMKYDYRRKPKGAGNPYERAS
jgi:predicted phage terminase large subunit-like protein